ncbi:MAG: hypothetical protein ACYCWC_09155 [Rhodocyclaceae bacterium]
MRPTPAKVPSARMSKINNSIVKLTHIIKLMKAVPHDAMIIEIDGGYNPHFIKQHYPNVF